jgi:hypothetical protein
MAKKSKQKDAGESVPKGAARLTLKKALFFLEQANRVQRPVRFQVFHYECYVEAAILFGVAALEHLRKEFGRKRGFVSWIELREQNPLIKDLIESRNTLSHQRPIGLVPSSKDGWVDEASLEIQAAYEKLRDQLDAIEAIIDECERQYK